MSTLMLDLLQADSHQPTLEPGWDGRGVRLVCQRPSCCGQGLFLDIDLPEHCTVSEAFLVAVNHVDEMHGG